MRERFQYFVALCHHLGYHHRDCTFNTDQKINQELINPWGKANWIDKVRMEHKKRVCVPYEVPQYQENEAGSVNQYKSCMSDSVRFVDNTTHHGCDHAKNFKELIYLEEDVAMELGHQIS